MIDIITLADLRASLLPHLGLRTRALLDLLHHRDGGSYPDRWRQEVEAQLGGPLPPYSRSDLPTRRWRPGVDRQVYQSPAISRGPTGTLLAWLNRLALDLGEEPLVFSTDPLWQRAARHLGATLQEHTPELLPSQRQARHTLLRRATAHRYGLESSTHLPASLWQREVTRLAYAMRTQGLEFVLREAATDLTGARYLEHVEYDWDAVMGRMAA